MRPTVHERGLTGLDSLLRDAAALTLRECAAALAALDVRALLDDCLSGPAGPLEVMAAESYRHANGFDKISFPGVDGSAARLRAHVWAPVPSGRSTASPHPHNHRWPFASRVLSGEVRNELYTVVDDPGGEHRRYSHRPAPGGGYVFHEQDRARLNLVEAFSRGAEQTYALPPEAVHRVTTSGQVHTVTLALELAPTAERTTVFVRSGTVPTGVPIKPACFTASGVRERLAALRSRL